MRDGECVNLGAFLFLTPSFPAHLPSMRFRVNVCLCTFHHHLYLWASYDQLLSCCLVILGKDDDTQRFKQ